DERVAAGRLWNRASQCGAARSDAGRKVVGTRQLGHVRLQLVPRPGAARRLHERRERRPDQRLLRLLPEHGAEVRERHGDLEHPSLAQRRRKAGSALRPVDVGNIQRQQGSGHSRSGCGVPVLTTRAEAPARVAIASASTLRFPKNRYSSHASTRPTVVSTENAGAPSTKASCCNSVEMPYPTTQASKLMQTRRKVSGRTWRMIRTPRGIPTTRLGRMYGNKPTLSVTNIPAK